MPRSRFGSVLVALIKTCGLADYCNREGEAPRRTDDHRQSNSRFSLSLSFSFSLNVFPWCSSQDALFLFLCLHSSLSLRLPSPSLAAATVERWAVATTTTTTVPLPMRRKTASKTDYQLAFTWLQLINIFTPTLSQILFHRKAWNKEHYCFIQHETIVNKLFTTVVCQRFSRRLTPLEQHTI